MIYSNQLSIVSRCGLRWEIQMRIGAGALFLQRMLFQKFCKVFFLFKIQFSLSLLNKHPFHVSVDLFLIVLISGCWCVSYRCN